MLWLALHLPQLPLEVFTRGMAVSRPAVAAEGGRVEVANGPAQAAGIRPGMRVAAAKAQLKSLQVFRRDKGREAECLAGLAGWAGRFTPHVTLEEDGLLLEIGGCLRLFGGAAKLLTRVEKGVRRLGYRALPAVAPTARAAMWLARAGKRRILTDPAELPAAIGELPLLLAEGAREHADCLLAMGVTTLGECLALPRAGVARRFGAALLEALDQALGRLPDPRPWFEPPAQFASRLELPAEVQDSGALLFAARRLLEELEGFLRGRGAGVQQFHVELVAGASPPTRLTVGLVSPACDARRLFSLLRERMAGLVLAQPVREIVFLAPHLLPYRARNLELFPEAQPEEENAAALIERLRARLGEGMVHGLQCVADHRPERAMKAGEPGAVEEADFSAPRPLWLLPRPRPLLLRGGVPHWGGPLTLCQGPERIEAGWWEEPVARDYFIAEAAGGARYWVYREATGAWFLHGIFA